MEEIGYVSSVNNYIIWLNGLPNVKINEIVVNKEGARGLVTSIEEELVEVLMLDDTKIKPQDEFRRTQKQLTLPVGSNLLGRAINPLGVAIDGKGAIGKTGNEIEVEQPTTTISSRDAITDQFETGITLADMLVPIAYGQRELIIGDNHSGKTGFLLDTVINQKEINQKELKVICIYGLIGKPINHIKSILEVLKVSKALQYTVIVATSSSEKSSLIYLNPAVATAIAEYFQKRNYDVLLILDDLGIHAKFYREISLLSGKAPGRDSYPGDVFYQHAKLLERAGKFNSRFGGGSITALPVIETNLDDFSSYITTNLMGMTDGHLLFSAARYHKGARPSIDVSLSVSRVGRQTQSLAQKSLADNIKALMFEASKLESYSRLGSEVSERTQFILKQGQQIAAILKQGQLSKVPIIVQMMLLGLVFTPLFGNNTVAFVETNKLKIIQYLLNLPALKTYVLEVSKMKNDREFIQSLNLFIPGVEKTCQI